MKNIKIIVGSVRTERLGRKIADWILKEAQTVNGADFSIVDLKDVNLPFMDEPLPPMMLDEYTKEHTKKWSEVISTADGLILIAPEYNHGYSPVLKNALDFLYKEWNEKPVGIVAYGGGAPMNSVKQLKEVLETLKMNVLSEQVCIDRVFEAIDENGDVKSENIRGDVGKLLEVLAS
ncbi:MAG: NAD(P)H-dependent oxidoreductase [Kiritimatiellae bacterium]|jgi:NAD(P)H-dependent FMN reductase|nr:NAD(P)H-dependent oxidoreductase [Kiritimatiellia bacterium]